MRENKIRIYILALLFVFIFSSLSFGQSYSRTITAWFNGIKMNVDGRIIESPREPFFYNNTLYVPIDDLSDALLFSSSYSEDNKTLKIDTNRIPYGSMAQYSGALQQRGIKIDQLNKEIEELEKKLKATEKELDRYKYGYRDYRYSYYDYPYDYYPYIYTTSEMQRYLRDYYSYFNDFPNTISLSSLGNNNYRLTIVIHSHNRSLSSVSSSSVENWLRDMHYSIRDLLNNNARIEGYILDYNYHSGNRNFSDFETINNQLYFYYN
ncbi:hypothetical protein [Serpentinicella alkaliphila]|uniref:Copper amine oxidase-like protein n=1 Tax=Serpentinicella alkaliphila TaxID=1734049 RepID=A0A4R2TSG1_9FIRM|nr:hypothetical protein [Serpentinicella alkaliphila]QUH25066.1 hypothetical protein HZR23_04205 [Serpentinicella alkaliphila]TCQ00489.1 hypothetical protein EDD79_10316 [Serpentinicella alkaliphila]